MDDIRAPLQRMAGTDLDVVGILLAEPLGERTHGVREGGREHYTLEVFRALLHDLTNVEFEILEKDIRCVQNDELAILQVYELSLQIGQESSGGGT